MIAGIKLQGIFAKKRWVKTIKCKVKDLDVYYETRGQGNPIIILHGFSLDHRSMVGSMEPVFRYRKGWRRIYPDLPGHGQTLVKDWINSTDDILDVVLEFIDTLIPNQRFVIEVYPMEDTWLVASFFEGSNGLMGCYLLCPWLLLIQQTEPFPPKRCLSKMKNSSQALVSRNAKSSKK